MPARVFFIGLPAARFVRPTPLICQIFSIFEPQGADFQLQKYNVLY